MMRQLIASFGRNRRGQMRSRKSQMKIQQMAFMLMAVVLLFILAILFFFVFQTSGLKKDATELSLEKAMSTAQVIASTPEFSCGQYCIDTDRLMVLMNRSAYVGSKFWPVTKIKIVEIYPRNESVYCTVSNYPDCDVYDVYDLKKVGSSAPGVYVSLCGKEKREEGVFENCRLGMMIVGFESKDI